MVDPDPYVTVSGPVDTRCLKTKRRTDGEPKRKEYRMITGRESAQDHQYPHCRRVSNVKSAVSRRRGEAVQDPAV